MKELKKVLVSHDDTPSEIHFEQDGRHTVCGETLHPINSTYINNKRIRVTCRKCLQKVPPKLTVGMRALMKPNKEWSRFVGHEVLLDDRVCGGEFAVLVLGQKELKKKDPKTVINHIAWVPEKYLEFVDTYLEDNLAFIDWYRTHEDEFCPDCGIWFPYNGATDPKTGQDYICPNEDCDSRNEENYQDDTF